MNIYQVILFILLPVVGIGLLLYALFLGKRLEGNPIEIKIEKPKLDLTLDRPSLVILLGVFLMVIGVLMWNQGYKTKVSRLEDNLKSAKNEIVHKDNLLGKFKYYSMQLPLFFPENDITDANDVSVQVYIQKEDMESPILSDSKKVVGISQDISVYIDYLNPGDKLRIRAYEGEGKVWEGVNIVEVPKINIQMRRVE